MGIFKPIYSELRGEEVDEFVCSLDGINIQPNVSRDISHEKDWPHCDQTRRDDIFKCVQGQVVLTNTQACFRASPKSHHHFVQIMETCSYPDNNSNWAKFTDEKLKIIKQNILEPNQVNFQVPIRSSKGSVVLWFSSTIHSAMSSGVKEKATHADPFKGWRGVVYVCYRPLQEFTAGELNVLEQCINGNKGTNHWATKVFTQPRGRNAFGLGLSENIEKYWNNRPWVYQDLGFKPHLKSCLINEPIDMNGIDPTAGVEVHHQHAGAPTTTTSTKSKSKSKSKGRVQGGFWKR